MEWIKRAWQGEERLWKVFWIYGVLGSIGLRIITVLIAIVLPPIICNVFWVFRIVYFIWLLVAQWRCAFNTDWQFWSYIVRGLIVFSILVVGGVVGSYLMGPDWTAEAVCKLELQKYLEDGGTDAAGFKQQCLQQMHTHKGKFSFSYSNIAPDDNQRYTQQCEKAMTDYALGHGIDPQQYIAQNQSYIRQCVEYYEKKNEINNKQIP